MDDGVQCPRCRTTKYRNPNLKLLVNICGHSLCENCVELLFVRGSGQCPECNLNLRRANFRMQFFEDSSMDKEIDIRKRILKDYNLKADCFSNPREYDDYLEEIEDIIFNLVNDIDIDETKKRIDKYKKEHQEQITKNKFRKTEDELLIEQCIAEEKSKKSHYQDDRSVEREQQKQREKQKQLLVDDLMYSTAPASEILKSHAEINQLNAAKAVGDTKPAEPQPDRQSNLTFGSHTTFMPIPLKKEVLYKYQSLHMEHLGPTPPALDDIKHKGYIHNIRQASKRELAGGFIAHLACMRALQSAVNGLHLGVPEHSRISPGLSSGSPEMLDDDDEMDVDVDI